jgi:hypothetical protein
MEEPDQPPQSQTIETLLPVIESLRQENALLKARLAELERRLGLDSSNSSKPPSSGGLKRPSRTGSLREKPGKELAEHYSLNPKTVAKWKKRTFVHDAPMGTEDPRSTVLSIEEEAITVAFRKHTLLPLHDCLYALQATIPHLTRSSLHRCYQRHGISRLPEVEGDKPAKKAFKKYPIGYFHVDIAEVSTGEGKLFLFVAVDRTSKFAFAQLHREGNAGGSRGLLTRADRSGALQDPHRPDRQWYPLHDTRQHLLDGSRTQRMPCERGACPGPRFRTGLRQD